jgi:hypothetical protein
VADLIHFQPRRRPVGAVATAASRILSTKVTDAPQPEAWHQQAWDYRNSSGEVRYAEMWLGNTMARARLVAATRERPGAEPTPLDESHPASQYVASLAGGVGGQSALLRAFGIYLTTPGVGYLVGVNPQQGGGPTWQVRDAAEVRLSTYKDPDTGMPFYEVACGDLTTDWESIGPDGLVVKVHRPDPQRYWRPDSPVRGAFPILRELQLLTQAIEAQATSRLAGAGILPLPQSMRMPPDPNDAKRDPWEYFVDSLIKAVSTPIKDRGSAAAYVPFPLRVPDELVDKLKVLQFFTPFDEHAIELRADLLHRLGTAMDMPVQQATGEDMNHWGKAQLTEEGLNVHVKPDLELVCDGLTRGYLWPALARSGAVAEQAALPPGGRLLAEATQAANLAAVDTAGNEIIIWYDLSDLQVKPDRSDDATGAYDRIELAGTSYLAELGLADAEMPTPEEFDRRVWLKVVDQGGDAGLVGLALTKLGLVDPADLPSVPAPAPPGTGTPPPTVPASPGESPAPPGPVPQTEPQAPAPSEGPRPTAPQRAAVDLALVAAADGLVSRALEKAGNRLRQATVRQRAMDVTLDAPAAVMHTRLVATAWRPMDDLLDGVWDRVGEVAALVDVDAGWLQRSLEAYVTTLITGRVEHTYAGLAAALEAHLAAADVLAVA